MQCCGSRRGPSSNGSRGQAAVAEFEGRVAALENQLQGLQGEAVVDASVTLKRGGGDAETNGMCARGKLERSGSTHSTSTHSTSISKRTSVTTAACITRCCRCCPVANVVGADPNQL